MVIKKVIGRREEIIKHNPKFKGMKSYKNMRTWIIGRIQTYSKSGNAEWEFAFREILNAYNHFHPEVKAQLKVESWKGKSSYEIKRNISGIEIIKYQRKDKCSEPKEKIVEVTYEELMTLVSVIKKIDCKVKTRDLAKYYCLAMEINFTDKGKDLFKGDFWDNFFSWRSMHNKFTLMLGALDYHGFINYSGGNTERLLNNFEVQTMLK